MKKFDLIAYIRKFQILIIICSLLAGVIGYLVLSKKQTYTASAIIRYANAAASEGLAPDGSTIDTTEIYSSKVVSEVFSRMDLDYTQYNIDNLRSRVTVTPVQTDEAEVLEEAKISRGEELTEQPVEYKVTFTATHDDESSMAMEDFARQFLDEMLDVYIATYAKQHINSSSPAVNDVSKLNDQQYDYLEKAEILKNSINAACDQLDRRAEAAEETFRASSTGYNFSDLKSEFALLKNVEISNLFSYILDNRVTQNRYVLLAKYENRINDYQLDNQESQEHITAIEELIAAYVKMMRESGNTDITYEYILGEVDDGWYTDEEGNGWFQADQTVEYDDLMKGYISENTSYEAALVDIAYCQYILDVYNGLVQDGEEIAVTAEGVAASESEAAPDVELTEDTAEEGVVAAVDVSESSDGRVQETAQRMIDQLAEKMNTLYAILEETNDEYNEYVGASNINLLAGISVKQGIAIGRYVVLIVALFGVIGCAGAVVVGRMADIFEYYVYYDRNLNLPNRLACDKFITGHSHGLLDKNFTCISIRVLDMAERNRTFGREIADNMLKAFANMIKANFTREEKCFIGINGFGQFLIFAEEMTEARAYAYIRQLKKQVADYNSAEACGIDFSVGIAESASSDIYQIKELMFKAFASEKRNGEGKNDKKQDSGAKVILADQLDELRKMLHG